MDLREFSFNARKLDFIGFNQLCRFLETQTNLEKFEFIGSAIGLFSKKFSKVLSKHSNLKSLDLRFDSSEIDTSTDQKTILWKLEKIEKLKIDCWNYDHYRVEIIFHFPSIKFNKLKKLELSGCIDFTGGRMEEILKNNKSLTYLDVYMSATNFSSDNIFLILQYLKKLRFLAFRFPSESALDITKFDGPHNLTLPEIEKAEFMFNDSITNDHISRLLPFLTNLEEFSFNVWKNYNQTTLEIITKKLPKLKILNIGKSITAFEHLNPNERNLEAIKEIVQKYNINPDKLKLYIESVFRGRQMVT